MGSLRAFKFKWQGPFPFDGRLLLSAVSAFPLLRRPQGEAPAQNSREILAFSGAAAAAARTCPTATDKATSLLPEC
jgi:hypothetical protein